MSPSPNRSQNPSHREGRPKRMISRLFIANRGEIARRIATTAGRLGIDTVALTDKETPPAYLLDVVTELVRVPEESPALYLDAARMIALAREHRCDAVHPGFGFLSESAEFAAAVEAAGLIWVGPKPSAIEAMASKATARHQAERASVPCVQGLSGFAVPDDERGDFSELEAFAERVGYPLLLKAAFGGGGKGMRQVHQASELKTAALRAHSEAKHAFGNGALICEQYLTAPRHVEVQILADQHGQVVAVGDRDCSIQRRHQKIVEEAPAPELTDETRRALYDAAIRLAQAVGYDSTGTVEFLVDWSEASRTAALQKFYFLEMNTRLQVEHPVSEEVYGLDLVEWQLRVAMGERLPESFATLTPRGHSVEVRIYAEDPLNNFFPSPGPVAAFVPAQGPGLRWEIGLDTVDEITGRFDPMIAKLVATGADRPTALARLADSLSRTFFAGPPANLSLLQAIAADSPFAHGAVTTHFLDEHLAGLKERMAARQEQLASLGAELLDLVASGAVQSGETLVAKPTVARLTSLIYARNPGAAATSSTQGKVLASSDVRATAAGGQWRTHYGLACLKGADGKARPFWYAAWKNGTERRYQVALDGCSYERRVTKEVVHGAEAESADREIAAPVPGKVVAIKAAVGTAVAAGETVLVLESMKMEFEVKAAKAAKLAEIHVKSGDQVAAGQILATWAD